MKKIIALLLAAALCLSASAFAATYTHDDDITFEYDDKYFEIAMDDHTDDEDLIVLTDKNGGSISIQVLELEDGEKFPTPADFESAEVKPTSEVETLETWANFKNVLNFSYDSEENHQDVFIAPVYDDDGEIDAVLTVSITGQPIADEDAATESSDRISEVVDTLRVND